jgi:RNA polymerase sigma factor (sigma-70 family)
VLPGFDAVRGLYYNAAAAVKPGLGRYFLNSPDDQHVTGGVQPALGPAGSSSAAVVEDDLVARCRRGDEAAWRELVARHTTRVFRLAYRFVGRVDEAEDLTQDIFIKVFQSLERYRESDGAFSTWLTTVARNHAIDNYRRRREERLRRRDDPEMMESFPSSEESPLRSLERQDRARLVHRGLRALPTELREPLVLCDLQGLPYEDVAQTLGIPLGTVKSRINRGRLELAKRLITARRELEAPR